MKVCDEIGVIADYCATVRGAKVKIRREFERVSGRKARRENFDRWLHRDPEKRTSPLFQNGAWLIEAGRTVMEKGRKE